MSARTVGVKIGRGLGFVAATAWKGTVVVAEGAGQMGEGFLEGAESGWEDRCAAMEAAHELRLAANKVKLEALRARLEAERAAAIETAPSAPVKAKRTAAA
jgi:hypothetical protein